MTGKLILLSVFVWLGSFRLDAQFYSTATASTGAEIIIPVGTEQSGDQITGNFYPGKKSSTIEFIQSGVQVDGRSNLFHSGLTGTPVLHVISSQQAYSISITFDPVINNRCNKNDSIQVASIRLLPGDNQGTMQHGSDWYTIGATLLVGPSQAPGQYLSGSPYQLTVYFN